MKHRVGLWLCLGLLVSCHAAPPRRLVIRAARLVDGTTAPVQQNVRIEINDGVITAIGPDRDDVQTAPPLDPTTQVIDARAHTVLPGLVEVTTELFANDPCAPTASGISDAVHNLELLLRAGVTTVIDVSRDVESSIALREYVGTGRNRGPRVIVAGMLLGRETHPQDVRDLADAEVDLVALNVAPLDAVACAAIAEAHTQELRVITTQPSADNSMCVADGSVTDAIDAFACGRSLAPSGRSPTDVLHASTQGGASLAGLGDALGRVTVGYRADLMVVRGRPDETLADLTKVEQVIIDGVLQDTRGPWLGAFRASLTRTWRSLTR